MAKKKKKFKVDFRLLRILLFSLILLFAVLFDQYLSPKPAAFKNNYKTLPISSIKPTPSAVPNQADYTESEPFQDDSDPWGVSKQISEHIWTIKVNQDDRMATPSEILSALNTYRAKFGSQSLSWDDKLASYAQSRADFFNSKGTLDSHAGFNDYLEKQDGFNKLGYGSVGENSSIGYRLIGVHIIEWIYAGDKPHNDNQIDKDWDHVGIGVNGTSTDLIFATSKL